jgi:hypothetical protein
MKPTCLVILNPNTVSLDFQIDILSNQNKWNNDFKIVFSYIVPELLYELEPALVDDFPNGQQTYLDLIDQVYSRSFDVDVAKLYTTKILLADAKSKVMIIRHERDLISQFNGFDLLIKQHCHKLESDITSIIDDHQVQTPPILLTCKLDNEVVRNVYFIFHGAEQNTQSLKYFTYLFDKKLMQYHIHVVTIVNESTIENERVVVEYVKSKFYKVSIDRIYEDEELDYYRKLFAQGPETTIITDKKHQSFLNWYKQQHETYNQTNLSNIFIS